ncbi:hypothetical protein DDV96_08275 [Marixanthomonas spongiae]|uniref:DUF3078 domain-containing protein n=2 Tax=Marixanthomonas spongiae TaxID=2174845 RepID=A0A2U0I102_9FLAO|nr:hypothetical protein DDV96_08275 [Marixanthomonas spongiae]
MSSSLQPKDPVFFRVALKQRPIKRSVYGFVKPTLWGSYNKIGVNVSEVAFVNWNAGGVSSVSGLINVDLKRTYKTKNTRWRNELLAKYGVNKQKELGWRKTEDNIELNSSFGFRNDSLTNLYYTAKLRFSTQFSNGYEYPDISNRISTIFSPAYLFTGIGAEYGANDENFSIYASPLTMKSTLVLDQELANNGAFGVKPAVRDSEGNVIEEGEHLLTQMGILITNEYKAKIAENITLSNKLSLYTDYLNDFGNIDIDWEVAFNFKVNHFVVANLGSHFIYDNDIKMRVENADGETIEKGPVAQWKQQLGIGITVEL